ncbi:GNAT family N-acetyltransferase [Desertihabitans aurantiacus]|uniref:GNAT family N-acetyltransferase n=1 Tax=Desertihabitans aurantiacus TaxID=2282477 RepID=UPI000DF72941|nr:GNAT family N-acetyltransferase [Desertihabitans aurantiacus]
MEVTVHDARAAAGFRDDVLRVWNAVFGPVAEADAWRAEVWDRHRGRADYRLGTAHDDRGRLVGFSWGYTGQRGQFWPDAVVEKLGAAVEGWVGGHFEFVELAVLPDARRQGAGGALHDAVLAGLPHDRALLGTSPDPEDPAVRLFRSRGWHHLGLLRPDAQVMGRRASPAQSSDAVGLPE